MLLFDWYSAGEIFPLSWKHKIQGGQKWTKYKPQYLKDYVHLHDCDGIWNIRSYNAWRTLPYPSSMIVPRWQGSTKTCLMALPYSDELKWGVIVYNLHTVTGPLLYIGGLCGCKFRTVRRSILPYMVVIWIAVKGPVFYSQPQFWHQRQDTKTCILFYTVTQTPQHLSFLFYGYCVVQSYHAMWFSAKFSC